MIRKIVFIILFIMCISPNAQAQLLIEKGKIRMDVAPRETVYDTIAVHNTSKRKLEVKVYWQDFEYVAPFYDGSKKFLPPGTSPRTMAGWVTINPTTFTLAPQASRDVTFSIKVPDYIKGGYNGIMFFELDAQKPDEKVGVSIVTRIGSLFFLDSKDKDKSVSFRDFSVEENIVKGVFVNAGDIIMIPDVTYFILNKEGMVEGRGELKKFYLPPRNEVAFQLVVDQSLKQGKYSIILTFDMGDGDSIVRELDVQKNAKGDVALLEVRE